MQKICKVSWKEWQKIDGWPSAKLVEDIIPTVILKT
jgi:hypothetical protein